MINLFVMEKIINFFKIIKMINQGINYSMEYVNNYLAFFYHL